MGNLIAVKRGTGEGRRVMFSAHMDTIGLMVYAADEKGFLRVTPLGGVSAAQMVARKVVFENGAEAAWFLPSRCRTANTRWAGFSSTSARKLKKKR